jgi:hypothetical protein
MYLGKLLSYQTTEQTKPFTPWIELRWAPDENMDLFPIVVHPISTAFPFHSIDQESVIIHAIDTIIIPQVINAITCLCRSVGINIF